PGSVRLATQLAGGTGWISTLSLHDALPICKAVLTSPGPGSTLPGAAATFGWSTGAGATQYSISVGTTGVGSFNVYSQGQGTNLGDRKSTRLKSRRPVYSYVVSRLSGGTGWV